MSKVTETCEEKIFHKLIYYGLFILCFPTKIGKRIKWSYYTFTTLISCFLILGSIVTIANAPTGLYKLQAITRLFFTVSIAGIFPITFANQDQLLEIVSKFDRNSPTYIGDEEMKMTAKTFMNVIKKEIVIFSIAGIIAEVAGIWGIILRQDLYDFMYLYSCGPIHEQPVIQYCVWQGSLGNFLLNDAIVFLLVTYQSAIAQIGQWLIISSITGIAAKIQRYDDLSLSIFEKVTAMEKSDSRDCLLLKTLIRYQQNVIQHIRPVRCSSRIPTAFHVILFYVMVIFFVVPIGSKTVEPMYFNVPFLVIVGYIVHLHYAFCKSWQSINSAQEHFCDTLLEFPWYERNVKFQKFYLRCLQLNQKCYPNTFLGLSEVNLRFFAANMNRWYSVVNVLLWKYRL